MEIGLQWRRGSSVVAMRSVFGGLRTRSVLGGSGIVEGGFEKSVSPTTWE